MQNTSCILPSTVDQLKNVIATLQQKLEEKEQKIDSLEHQLRLALQARFGKKTEKSSDKQLSLFDEAVWIPEETPSIIQTDEEITIASFTRKKGGRQPLPAYLPREQVIHDLPETEKTCACGSALHKMGEDKSEQLSFIPAQVKVLEHIRYKYACRHCEEGVKVATLPAQPIPKSIATAELLAHVLISKYQDHLPLYRQEQILQRYQVDIARSTLCYWVLRCAELFEPLVALLKERVVQSSYVGVDETPVQVIETKEKSSTRQGYMWVYVTGLPPSITPRFILYDYQPTRRSEAANHLLSSFKGYLQTDGYAGYQQLQARAEIKAVGCWAHARRKFVEITKTHKKEGKAFEALKFIKQLYVLEKDLKARCLSFDEIKHLREQKAQPILAQFKTWLEQTLLSTPPQGPLAKAINYSLHRWDKLQGYLESGELQIDNNFVENTIRPFALGRKNWLFMGNERGAKAAAAIYSLLMTAKANQIEPYGYIRYLLEQLPNCKSDEQRRLLLPPHYKSRLNSQVN